MMDWIIGIVVTVLALVGLFLAGGAYDVGMSTFGYALFAFGMFFDFWLIKKSFDNEERAAPPVRGSAHAE
jgi:FtsH-binding integral membrane protein